MKPPRAPDSELAFEQAELVAAAVTAGVGPTAAGAVVGTPGYISPDQVRAALDGRTDVYALSPRIAWDDLRPSRASRVFAASRGTEPSSKPQAASRKPLDSRLRHSLG